LICSILLQKTETDVTFVRMSECPENAHFLRDTYIVETLIVGLRFYLPCEGEIRLLYKESSSHLCVSGAGK